MSETGTQMSAEAVKALLKAKASDLNWYERTIRNAIRAARRQGHTLYVGRTYTRAHITPEPGDGRGLSLDFACHADGSVVKYL
jgi:hypothetical protein